MLTKEQKKNQVRYMEMFKSSRDYIASDNISYLLLFPTPYLWIYVN